MVNENEQENEQQQEVVVDENQAQSQENEQVSVESSQSNVDEVSPEERASQVEHIMAMAEQDPAVKDLPEYKEMLKEMEASSESKTQVNNEESTEEQENENEEENEQENEEENENESENEEVDEDNVFGLSTKKGKSKYKFKDEKDVVKLIQKKGFKEVPTFFESVDKWRNDSQKFVEVSEKNEQIEQGLSSLPQPIKSAILAFSQSEDWRSAFSDSATSLDFSSEFEDLNKEEVVKYYFKDKYEKLKTKLDEDVYDEEEYEDRITDFYESSQRLFVSDKTAMETKRAKIIDTQNREAEALKESALSSVKALKQEYPNFKASQLQKVRQSLVNGDLDSLFKDEGKYIDDAAERIAYALYGKQILKAGMEKAETKGASKSKEAFFERGNKTPKTRGSQQGFSNQQTNKAVSHLTGQFKDDPYA